MVHLVESGRLFKRNGSRVSLALKTVSLSPRSSKQASLLPKSRIISVPQVVQTLNWDCGLACLLMVLRAAGISSESLASLQALCPFKSVWTVDLAHILRQFGLVVQFTTLTIGTNPGFVEESFYGKLHEDAIRVKQLFEAAMAVGIDIQQRSVSTLELQQLLLAGQHLVIALVDKDSLEGGLALWSCPHGASTEDGYKGHYIVICGYDSETDHFILRDPDPRAAAMGLCSVRSPVLERARRAFGTDEDLLIVQLPFSQELPNA